MLGLAGIPLGLRFRFLDPAAHPPAGAVGPVVAGALDDLDAARRPAADAAVITYEWEGVPAATARGLADVAPVWPPAGALEVSQDRLAEKKACTALGIGTAGFRAVESRADLEDAVSALGLPAVLKTRRG